MLRWSGLMFAQFYWIKNRNTFIVKLSCFTIFYVKYWWNMCMLATLLLPKNITRNWGYDSSMSALKESFQNCVSIIFLVNTKTIQGISKLPFAFYVLCWFVFEWFVWASWKIVNLNWLITWNFDGSLCPLKHKCLKIP